MRSARRRRAARLVGHAGHAEEVADGHHRRGGSLGVDAACRSSAARRWRRRRRARRAGGARRPRRRRTCAAAAAPSRRTHRASATTTSRRRRRAARRRAPARCRCRRGSLRRTRRPAAGGVPGDSARAEPRLDRSRSTSHRLSCNSARRAALHATVPGLLGAVARAPSGIGAAAAAMIDQRERRLARR